MMNDKKALIAIIAALVLFAVCICIGSAYACEGMHDIGIANTAVYVRSTDTGEVIGSLRKGDTITITGRDGNWYKAEIGGNTYKVYSEYVDLTDSEVMPVKKVRKSKSAAVQNKKSYGIKGSDFDGLKLW